MNNDELEELLKKSFKDERYKSPFNDKIDNLMNNPDIIIKNLTKLTEECQKVNKNLKTKLKSKQAEIDFLKGQLSVYEKLLEEKKKK